MCVCVCVCVHNTNNANYFLKQLNINYSLFVNFSSPCPNLPVSSLSQEGR